MYRRLRGSRVLSCQTGKLLLTELLFILIQEFWRFQWQWCPKNVFLLPAKSNKLIIFRCEYMLSMDALIASSPVVNACACAFWSNPPFFQQVPAYI